MILDIHTHIFPFEIASLAVDKLKRASRTRPFTDGTSAGLVRSRQEAGIDLCAVLPVATSPQQVVRINDRAILTNTLTEETGLFSFGGMHPDFEGWKSELARIAHAGVKGIKLHPVFQRVRLDDPRYLRILDCAAGLGLVTLVHAGLDVEEGAEVFCTPQMILHVSRELGRIPLILAHMGGWRQWDEAEEVLPQTPFYLDTSYCTGPIEPLDPEQWEGPVDTMPGGQFVRFVRLFGADRILFGSDSPWQDQKASLARLRSYPLTPQELEGILGGNAARLLGIPAGRAGLI